MTETAETFLIKVNGFEIRTTHETLVAHAILELAEKEAAFPGKSEDYMLLGDKGMYGRNDCVNVREDDLFVAVPSRATPVA